MRYGCCITFRGSAEDLDRVQALRDMGYQYIEPPVGCLRVEGEPEEYYAVRRAFHRAALVPEAFNCLFPPDLKVVGDEVDWRRVERYLARAFERIEELGGTTVVLGSGGSRQVPEGYPPEEALTQVRYFLNMAVDYAGDLTVAVEPISQPPGDVLGTVEVAADLVRQVGRPEVRLAPDSLQMAAAGDSMESITAAGDLVAHVHCCDRDGLAPGRGGADLAGFFAALKQAGYDGRVSVDCPLAEFEQDATAALEGMKQAAGR